MAKKTKGTVGIIGLGIMGGAFAANLAAAGWRVIGYDISAARRREAKGVGAKIARNAVGVAASSPVILTTLPKPQALMDTARKIAAANLPRKVVVEMSTFTIADKEKAARVLKKAGHEMLDTPVSGTGSQAKKKDLIFYASGNARTIKKLNRLFKDFGRAAFNVGPFGNGSKIKYVANLLVAINNVASAEAMVLGMKAGLAPKLIYDLVTAGAGNSRVFELRGSMMVKGRYDDVTMKIDVWDKDMQVIGDYARKIGVRTPMFNASKPVYLKAMSSGLGAKDTAAVCSVLEKASRFRRKR
jgi:3-hydroxyisobutyrate dehydrogenase-like beta-hydroxyacid dehydrogenase